MFMILIVCSICIDYQLFIESVFFYQLLEVNDCIYFFIIVC